MVLHPTEQRRYSDGGLGAGWGRSWGKEDRRSKSGATYDSMVVVGNTGSMQEERHCVGNWIFPYWKSLNRNGKDWIFRYLLKMFAAQKYQNLDQKFLCLV